MNVSTRSMISEIDKNDMIFQKQMVYIIGIAVVVFVLVLMNVYNNLNYRIQVRVREIAMFRSVGMSVKMVRKMMLFENVMLGMMGVLLALFASYPVLGYLYNQSDMKAFAHSFQFEFFSFFLISFVVIVISMFVTIIISMDWKTKKIVEQMS